MSEYSLAKEYDPELNPYIPRKEAIDWAKNEGVDINFDYDPTSDEMSLLVERKREENDRQAILAAGTTGGGRVAGRMGVQFLGSILNPLDLPLMFLPIVGSGAKAAQGTTTLSRVLSRGLVTEEALAARGLAMKGYTAAIIEGAVGQAITEIPLMISNQQSEIDYTGSDLVTNIALGGAFGAGINTLRLGVNGVLNMHRRLTPKTQENMMGGAQDDFLRGQDIDPGRYIDLDEEVGATKTLTSTVREFDEADADFKKNYSTLSPKQKDLYEFNKGNKLVDGNGLPVIVYHGRTWEGDEFDPTTLGKNTGASSAKEGFFFAGSPKTSQYYIIKSQFQNDPRVSDIMDKMDTIQKELKNNPAESNEILKSEMEALGNEAADRLGVDSVFREGGNVSAFMVSMKNPKIVDFEGQFHRPQTYKQVIAEAKAAGHDGVVIRNTFDGGPLDDIYVVFDKNSIKSAYDYRVVRDANKKIEGNQQAIADYKARQEKKAQAKSQMLQKEVDDGKMIPAEQVKTYREQPDESEFAALDEELEFLRGLDLEEEDWNKMTGRMADVGDLSKSKSGSDDIMPDSKVRDKSGNLKKLYHGGEKGITSFDQLKRPGSAYKQNSLHSEGIWFTPNKGVKGVQEDEFMSSYASTYALNYPEGEIYEVYVNITNPKKISQFEANDITLDELVAQGYDGAYTIDTGFWIATDPKQIQFVAEDVFPAKDTRSVKVSEGIDSQKPKSDTPLLNPKDKVAQIKKFTNDLNIHQWHKLTQTEIGKNIELKAEKVIEGFRLYMPDIAEGFDALLKIDPTLKNVKVYFDEDLLVNEQAYGMYFADRDLVIMNGVSSPKTFMHELVHGSAVRRFRKDLVATLGSVRTTILKGNNYLKSLSNYKKNTKNKPMSRLVEAYERAIEEYEDQWADNLIPYLNGSDEVYFNELESPFYGLLNFDEFMSEALSDRTFQLFLQGIPAVRGEPKTLLESFVESFKEFFFLKSTWMGQKGTTTLLDEILQDYSDMVKQGVRTPSNYLGNLRSMSSIDINKKLLRKASNCLLL
jgi:hypothetical protein